MTRNMKIHEIRVLIALGVLALLIIGFYLATSTITKYTGYSVLDSQKNDFKSCLRENDISIYINSEKSSKTLKEIELLEYLDNVKIINCFENNHFCLENGVNSFPSWIVNNNKFEEDISLSKLSESSGCKSP